MNKFVTKAGRPTFIVVYSTIVPTLQLPLVKYDEELHEAED